MPDQPLFDEKTRRKLEQLMLTASRVRAGAIKGERRSVKRGTSIEFADYRDYTPGDDLRRLDWNIYARLDRPLTKLYEDEEDLAVYLILDASASMDWGGEGDPEQHKFDYARRLIAGLGYISLTTNDRLMIAALSGSGIQQFGPARGRGYGVRLLNFINDLKPRGVVDLNAALRDYALRSPRPGLVLIVSDLFSPSGYVEGLTALLSKGSEVGIVHILAPDEIEPPLAGDLRLVDVETGAAQEVTIDGGMRHLYIERVQAWREGIRADCLRRGVHYLPIETITPGKRSSCTTCGGWEWCDERDKRDERNTAAVHALCAQKLGGEHGSGVAPVDGEMPELRLRALGVGDWAASAGKQRAMHASGCAARTAVKWAGIRCTRSRKRFNAKAQRVKDAKEIFAVRENP